MERIIDSLSKKGKIERKKNKAKKIADTIIRVSSILATAVYLGLGVQHLNSSYKDSKQYNIANYLIDKNLPTSDKVAFNFLQKNPNLIDKFPDNNFKKLKNLKRVVLDNDYSNQDSTVLEKKVINENNKSLTSNIINLEEVGDDLNFMLKFNLIYDSKDEILYKLDSENNNLEGKLQEVKDVTVLPNYVYFIQEKNVFRKSKEDKFEKVWKCDSKQCTFKKIWDTDFGIIFDDEVKVLEGCENIEKVKEYREIYGLLLKLGEFEDDSSTRIVYKNNTLYASNSSKIMVILKDKNFEIKPSFWGLFEDYILLDINKDGKDEIVASEYIIFASDRYRVFEKESYAYEIKHNNNLKFNYDNPVSEDFKLLMNPSKLKSQIKEKLKQ